MWARNGLKRPMLIILQISTVQIRSRVYSVNKNRPRQVNVATRCSPLSRSPMPESVLDDARLQPYVHDVVVTVQTRREVHCFTIFYKNHVRLRRNKCIRTFFRGDAVVMRHGSNTRKTYVNMRSNDNAIADYAMERWVLLVSILIFLVAHMNILLRSKHQVRQSHASPQQSPDKARVR